MARTTRSQSRTGSPTRKGDDEPAGVDERVDELKALAAARTTPAAEPDRRKAKGEESAIADQARIKKIRELGQAAEASDHMIRHLIIKGKSEEEAYQAFQILARDGVWRDDRNSPTFYPAPRKPAALRRTKETPPQ
jgi:hypothetical protein